MRGMAARDTGMPTGCRGIAVADREQPVSDGMPAPGMTPPHMTGQARVHLGVIQIVPYADAGSDKLRDLMVDVYRAYPETRIVLMANHGLAATGPTLLESYNRAEIVEDSAQAYLHCRILGREPKSDF